MNLPVSILRRPAPLGLMLVICLMLCSCTETRFASPPGGHLETCDARWKGLWLPRDEPNSDSAFQVDASCRFVMIEVPKNGATTKYTPIALKYAHVDDKNYLVVADDALKPLVDIKPVYGVDPVPKQAFYLARYVANGDNMDVYSVDSERVASRVIDRKLDGTVSKTANELHVFVSADAPHMLEILRGESIFSDKPGIKLIRSRMSVDEFERHARKTAGESKS
ncbi:MAG: hypothetical protein WBV39_09235 [Rudaea sp.]